MGLKEPVTAPLESIQTIQFSESKAYMDGGLAGSTNTEPMLKVQPSNSHFPIERRGGQGSAIEEWEDGELGWVGEGGVNGAFIH